MSTALHPEGVLLKKVGFSEELYGLGGSKGLLSVGLSHIAQIAGKKTRSQSCFCWT